MMEEAQEKTQRWTAKRRAALCCGRCPTSSSIIRLKQEYITPYTPEQNGLIERFFRRLKEECAWQYSFEDFQQASEKVGGWNRWYNEGRPHQALGHQRPAPYRKQRLPAA